MSYTKVKAHSVVFPLILWLQLIIELVLLQLSCCNAIVNA